MNVFWPFFTSFQLSVFVTNSNLNYASPLLQKPGLHPVYPKKGRPAAAETIRIFIQIVIHFAFLLINCVCIITFLSSKMPFLFHNRNFSGISFINHASQKSFIHFLCIIHKNIHTIQFRLLQANWMAKLKSQINFDSLEGEYKQTVTTISWNKHSKMQLSINQSFLRLKCP